MDDERQLIDRSQHGDLVAFNELVDRYQTQAYNLALRMRGDEALAADATHESPLPGGPGDGLRALPHSSEESPEEQALRSELATEIQRGLESLHRDQRLALVLIDCWQPAKVGLR